jgi:hypothetical protein
MECGLLDLWQDDSLLGLVFAFFIFVGDFALLVGFEEDYLAEAFVAVDFGW